VIALYRSVEARARGDATRELRDLATLLSLTAQRVENGERMQSDQLRQATSFALHVVYGWESALAVLTAVDDMGGCDGEAAPLRAEGPT